MISLTYIFDFQVIPTMRLMQMGLQKMINLYLVRKLLESSEWMIKK